MIHKLLNEYIDKKFPKEEYGDLTLEQCLIIYDSLGYKSYVFNKALTEFKESMFRTFKKGA